MPKTITQYVCQYCNQIISHGFILRGKIYDSLDVLQFDSTEFDGGIAICRNCFYKKFPWNLVTHR